MRRCLPELKGQQALELLTAALYQQRLAPALFAGPDGVGRSLTARRFLEGLCAGGAQADPDLRRRLQQGNHPDLIWVEPTYSGERRAHHGDGSQRAWLEQENPAPDPPGADPRSQPFLARPPLDASRSMVVIEQAEAMAESAANALLKTLRSQAQGLLVLITRSPRAPVGHDLEPLSAHPF